MSPGGLRITRQGYPRVVRTNAAFRSTSCPPCSWTVEFAGSVDETAKSKSGERAGALAVNRAAHERQPTAITTSVRWVNSRGKWPRDFFAGGPSHGATKGP